MHMLRLLRLLLRYLELSCKLLAPQKSATLTHAHAHTHMPTHTGKRHSDRPGRPGRRPAQCRQDFHSARECPPTAHGRAHPYRTTLARVVSRAVVISGRAAAFAEGGRRYKQARVRQHLAQGTVKRQVHSSACSLAGPLTSLLCKRA